ncbi:hypothetical protein [[Mycoplasma] cavipharyngis]|uniref:hypothetical protein n=1 Tax=[Mycoplasma] cavipharyngis TaxID=92757 RepID=UPI0037040817
MLFSSLVFGMIIFKFKSNIINWYKKFSLKKIGIDFNQYQIVDNNQQLITLWEKTNQKPFLSFFWEKIIGFSWLDLKFEQFLALIKVDPSLSSKFISKREVRMSRFHQQNEGVVGLFSISSRISSFLWIFCSSYSLYFANKYSELNKNSLKIHQIVLVIHWIISLLTTILFIVFFYQALNNVYTPIIKEAQSSQLGDFTLISNIFQHLYITFFIGLAIFLAIGALRNILLISIYHVLLKQKSNLRK